MLYLKISVSVLYELPLNKNEFTNGYTIVKEKSENKVNNIFEDCFIELVVRTILNKVEIIIIIAI